MMGAFLKITGLVPPDIFLSSMETVMGSKKKSVIETQPQGLCGRI